MTTELRERAFPFTITRASADDTADDGLTFEGYAAVFNSTAHIEERDGSEFDEVISPGAFRRTIGRGTPLFMFNHGKHPLIGEMPLGRITEIREDARGLYVKGRLTDNWLIHPVRDAIANGAVSGMSVRMQVVKDQWSGQPTQQLRTIREAKLYELGPVVAPAYDDTVAMVRSITRSLRDEIKTLDDIITEPRAGLCEDQDWSQTQMVEEAVETLLGINDQTSEVYTIQDIDGTLTYIVQGSDNPEHQGIWQVSYTYDDGTVAVSAPVHANLGPTDITPPTVENPAPARSAGTPDAAEDRQDPGPSEELATTGPSEEPATPINFIDASSASERRRYARQILADYSRREHLEGAIRG